MNKSKLIWILVVLMIGLSACNHNAAQSSGLESDNRISAPAESTAQEQTLTEKADASEELEEAETTEDSTILFVQPEPVNHPLADELLALVSGFSNEFLFPEFQNLENMDYADYSVSTHLYWLAYNQNDELLLKGSGLTQEEKDASGLDGIVLDSIVRYDDMNAIGQFYFGDDFLFPKGLEGAEVGPVDDDSTFYTVTKGRGGMGRFAYFLLDVSEQENTITATFLPFNPLVSWDDGTIVDVAFVDAKNDLFRLSYDMGRLEYPDDETRENAGTFSCLDYYYLTVPQEALGTLTITFQRAEDGRIIATSCRYNRK